MKKIPLILGLSCMVTAVHAQEIRDAKNNVAAYIDTHATSLLDKNRSTICIFKQDGRIVDVKANTLGFIVGEREIQNKEHKAVGYLTEKGTLEDANHKTISTISMTGSGPVMDKNNTVIGSINRVEPMWAAAYYLLLKS